MHDQVELALFAVAAVCQTLFVALYGIRPWWRHFIGRALFIKSFALMLLVDMALVHWFIDYPAEGTVTLVVYSVVTFAICFQLVALLAQGHARVDRSLNR